MAHVTIGPSTLDDDTLAYIFSLVPLQDILRLAPVCKRWQVLVSDRQVVQGAFLKKWRFLSLDPAFSLKELVSYSPSSFVTIHRMCRGDSMQSLAVRYGTSAVDIRVYNNLLSEGALPAHARVYVPLREPEAFYGKHLKRVVTDGMRRVLPVVCDKADEQELPEQKVPERVRRAAGGFRQLQVQLMAAEQVMHEGIARFYLDDTEGDARTAKQRLREDDEWEESDEGRQLLRQYHRQRHRARQDLNACTASITSFLLFGCIAGCVKCLR